MKLIKTPIESNNTHYTAYGPHRNYSVVDIGHMMGAAPYYKLAGGFMGWEAIRIDVNGELDTNDIFRAATWEVLDKILDDQQ